MKVISSSSISGRTGNIEIFFVVIVVVMFAEKYATAQAGSCSPLFDDGDDDLSDDYSW